MRHEGDVARAREQFLSTRMRNLEVLLRSRYLWMNDFIDVDDRVVEFGCGAGFSRLYIQSKNLLLTDVLNNPWVDLYADAMNPPFELKSIDVVICSHMIHHMAHPVTFFRKIHPILADGGRVIIQDLNTSFALRALLRVMRHEGWSYEVDVFDESVVTNDPADPWSANCAIPQLLFKSSAEFERRVPEFSVIKNDLSEVLLFPLSGGVISKTSVPELPEWLLSLVQSIDNVLSAAAPNVFAMGRSVVLAKR